MRPDSLISGMTRRRFLKIGGWSIVGAHLDRLAWANAATPGVTAGFDGPSPIRSCILVLYYGGPSHLDTWDMKPEAPREVRGEFRQIATNVPGRFVSEHFPRIARITDKLAVIRTMTHPMTNHNAAMVEALVGRTPVGGDLELLPENRSVDFPCYGAALNYVMSARSSAGDRYSLPHVALPHVMYNVVRLAGQNAGFLGTKFDPLQITQDPNNPNFRVDELKLPGDMSSSRLDGREALLTSLGARDPGAGAATGALSSYQERAFELLRSEKCQVALDIAREPDAVRDRYGRHTLGQSMLLARRLVESGVRFVNVNDKIHNGQLANWDSHENCFPRHRDDLMPPADQAFSALVEDLDSRGLLDSTLVVGLGEFGRTPKINKNGGRDHWPRCSSVVLAGGGIQGGMAYGVSDALGAYPDSNPVSPGDLAATLFWRFGLDPTHEIHDTVGRPYRLAEGEPLRVLFGAHS